jgi:hypothetical protein
MTGLNCRMVATMATHMPAGEQHMRVSGSADNQHRTGLTCCNARVYTMQSELLPNAPSRAPQWASHPCRFLVEACKFAAECLGERGVMGATP